MVRAIPRAPNAHITFLPTAFFPRPTESQMKKFRHSGRARLLARRSARLSALLLSAAVDFFPQIPPPLPELIAYKPVALESVVAPRDIFHEIPQHQSFLPFRLISIECGTNYTPSNCHKYKKKKKKKLEGTMILCTSLSACTTQIPPPDHPEVSLNRFISNRF